MLEPICPGILAYIPFRKHIIQRSHNAMTQNLQVIKENKRSGLWGIWTGVRGKRQGMGENQLCSVDPNRYALIQLLHIWPSNLLPPRAWAGVHFITIFMGGEGMWGLVGELSLRLPNSQLHAFNMPLLPSLSVRAHYTCLSVLMLSILVLDSLPAF